MGSGSSKRSSPTSGSAKADKSAIAKQTVETCSVPTQKVESGKLFKDEKHLTEDSSSVSIETKGNLEHSVQPDVFLTEVPQSWIELLNEVADSDLWSGGKRCERPAWRENLAKADELANLPRKPISLKTKLAAFNGELFIPDLPDMRRKVLVFVSSTFTDTKAERNQLMKDVYPYIRDVCRRLGLEFGTIDMRWGVTDEATKHHSTVNMCVDEIQRCIKESCGPAFLCILSHKYGYRPIPATIEESEFDMILAYLINNQRDTNLLKSFYRLDKNALKQEYVLRSMKNEEDKNQWWKNIDIIQNQIREAVVECFRGNPAFCDKYFISVTETEVQSGAFSNLKRDRQACFFIRELGDMQNKVHHHRRLRDMKESEVDKDADERLQTLVHKTLPKNIRQENIKTLKYEYGNAQGVMDSVRQFCDGVCQKLIDMVFENFKERTNVESDSDFTEVVQHLKMAEEKRSLFVGRDKELAKIKQYFTSAPDKRKPIVIYGASGSGKTSLMAVASQESKQIFKNGVVVVRFIGTTSQSGSLRSLLQSVCKQIAHAYCQDANLIPDSTRELADYFRNALVHATATTPLILLLDSLDQLSADDNGRKLEWLKLDEDLPENVKIVLSSLEADTLTVLQKHLPGDNFVQVLKLLPGEGPEILNKMLNGKGRRLTESQMKVVLNAFLNSPLPLYLSLASDVSSRWKSYDTVKADDISPTIKGMILLLFEHLEKTYGENFVRHALAYITAAKHGLSQEELEDILSCDDEVLDSLFQYWTPPMRRMPPLLWARVRHELGQYLAERGSDGVTIFTWFHRQFSDTAKERYLDATDGSDRSIKAHIALADYFDGKWVSGKPYVPQSSTNKEKPELKDRGLPSQPFVFGDSNKDFRNINKRKIRELPYHLLKISDSERFSSLALDLDYVRIKFEAEMGHEYFSELAECVKISGADSLLKMLRFIGSNLSFLLREPFSVYQLASQQLDHHAARQRLKQLNDLPVNVVTNNTSAKESSEEACELTLQGHKESPMSCDVSPKGDKIVSTSIDGCLIIWDVLTGSEIAVNTSLPAANDPDKVNGPMRMLVHTAIPCCFSRDGKNIATGTEDGGVIIFDSDGSKLKCEPTENDMVTCIQYSPDNKSIATGFMNGKIYIWSAEKLEHRGTLQLENDILDLDYSLAGDTLAVACRNGIAKVNLNPLSIDWFKGNQPALKQKMHSRRAQRPELVLCCCYHPAGRRIMSGSADNYIGIWDTASGKCVKKIGDHSAWIWSIKITKDGCCMFSSSSDRSIKVWTSAIEDQWEVVSTVYGHSHRVVCLALDTSSESRLVSASLDCTLKVWDVRAMKTVKSDDIPGESELHFNTLAISPTLTQIAKSNGWSNRCEILNINSQDDNNNIQTESHRGFIKKAEFTCDGSKLVVLDHGHEGDYLANSALNAKCVVYYAKGGKKLQELNVSADGTDGPTSFSCSRAYIVVGTMLGSLLLFDVDTYQLMTKWNWKPNEVSPVSSPLANDNMISTSGLDVNTFQPITNLYKEPNISTVSSSLENGHVISTSGLDCTLWKISDKEQKIVSELPAHDSDITRSAFSPDGLSFVTGVESGNVYIWDILDSTVKLHQKLTSHTAPIKDINFSKSGRFMVTCADLSTRIWDTKNNYVLTGVYYAPVNCTVFKNEREILAGDATGRLNTLCF